eukprot:Hpha_TRINITY_DN16304_c4_g4::TRINITY_DN16304_c4_g4_i1::g.59227::m.59227/K16729/CHORDC1, CHP1; cysteine and histidine-rich domain-containing protein 1
MAEAAAAALHAACGGDAGRTITELFRHLRKSGCAHFTGDDQEKEWVLDALKGSAVSETSASAKEELRPVSLTVTAGAQKAFDKAQAEAQAAAAQESQESKDIPIGTQCKRNGCKRTYQGPESSKVVCDFHPGAAVFHETYKYWSCCDTTRAWDWDDFQKIVPCRHGPEFCAFTDDAPGLAKRAPCRHDFFQVGTGVTWNIFAKKVDPKLSSFLLSPTHVKLQVVFDGGKVFKYNAKLSGKVVPDQCKVEIGAPKIEITLVKAPESTGAAWERIGEEIADE